ncbi:hypothetical protein SCHPADRAFT_672457 [Schizopora paradoxa]|uniref:DUF6533 domain-containing protein n=1 Tax=Schizopora paradoxa TaxID=27342 RepID=A0A0H2RQ70_9AGAM|nr:hypothetical protein SCHPADRAFT_672457 [Schizopora paradoxa]
MEVLDDILRTYQIFQYTTVATVSLVAYEYLINLDAEIRYLWGRRVSFGGMLMALCRYLPLVNISQIVVYVVMRNSDSAGCLKGNKIVSSFVLAEFILAVLVLFTRAYAVWGGGRIILCLIAFVLSGSVAGSGYALFLFLSDTEVPVHISMSTSCLIVLGNDDVWIGLAFLLFCEALALGLLLIKSIQHARETKDLVIFGTHKQSILAVMAQDGIGYFACTLAITSANLIVLGSVTPDLRDFLFITQGALQNILCGRLLFHVRAVNECSEETLGADISTMRFETFLAAGTGDYAYTVVSERETARNIISC